jgi:hypothetical protein
MRPATRCEAFALLSRIGAPARLVRHAELVGEAADALLDGFAKLRVPMDAERVRVGVALHDAGKTLHPNELDGPGAAHEPDGERLLLEHGASADVARVCRTHARWTDTEVIEELVVALADKLWKGARVRELEERVIDAVAAALNADRWDLFTQFDQLFEDVAAAGQDRLARSRG